MMDVEAIRDIFSEFGDVTVRRMFGGQGVYHDGLIIAIVVDGELKLKADDVSAPQFEAEGCSPWAYEMPTKSGAMKTGIMPYWTLPDGAADDPSVMAKWARLSHEASVRTAARKAKRKR